MGILPHLRARGALVGIHSNVFMKRLLLSVAIAHRGLYFLAISFITGTTLAPGLVNFQNTSTRLVRTGPNGELMNGPPGSYYFALLFDPDYNGNDVNNPLNYTFTGLYATNQATAGRFRGGAVAVPGVPPQQVSVYALK